MTPMPGRFILWVQRAGIQICKAGSKFNLKINKKQEHQLNKLLRIHYRSRDIVMNKYEIEQA